MKDNRSGGSFRRLLESSFLLSAVGLLAGVGNYAFQGIIGRRLSQAEFGFVNGALSFVTFLSLPLSAASMAITHYIARFNAAGDEARLGGLLAGCRRFLLRLTLAGSIVAIVLVKPLGDYFHIPRNSLTFTALICVVAGLWGTFAASLCQGLAWFKRLALIGLLGMILRLAFGGAATLKFPTAEIAVSASFFAFLSNLLILCWRKELVRGTQQPVSPWNREFVQYFIVSAACVSGSYFFTQGDMLVAQRYFPGSDLGAYSAAEKLAAALPMVVAPLLTVLFTHRSGRQSGGALQEQLKLVGLYAIGLAIGAVSLLLLGRFLLRLMLAREAPESAAMIGRLAVTMVFVGLLQALGLWALASRWLKLALLFGGLGLAYWLTLLCLGQTTGDLLHVMPLAAGIAFAALFLAWLFSVRGGKPAPAVH